MFLNVLQRVTMKRSKTNGNTSVFCVLFVVTQCPYRCIPHRYNERMVNMKTNKRTAAAAGGRMVGKRGGRVTTVTPPPVPTITDLTSAMAAAKSITPDTFMAELARVNRDHGMNHGTRNVSRFGATRIQYTQNAIFAMNAAAELTDVQIAWVWNVCFPMATGGCFDPNRAIGASVDVQRAAIVKSAAIVNGARREFNAGTHGCPAPAVPSVRYGSARIAFAPPTT